MTQTPPPDPAALAAEKAWVAAMKQEIVAELDSWLAAAVDPEPAVRMGAHCLLADLAEHVGERRAEAELRVALASARDRARHSTPETSGEHLVERLEDGA
jgi:hypothetical protein